MMPSFSCQQWSKISVSRDYLQRHPNDRGQYFAKCRPGLNVQGASNISAKRRGEVDVDQGSGEVSAFTANVVNRTYTDTPEDREFHVEQRGEKGEVFRRNCITNRTRASHPTKNWFNFSANKFDFKGLRDRGSKPIFTNLTNSNEMINLSEYRPNDNLLGEEHRYFHPYFNKISIGKARRITKEEFRKFSDCIDKETCQQPESTGIIDAHKHTTLAQATECDKPTISRVRRKDTNVTPARRERMKEVCRHYRKRQKNKELELENNISHLTEENRTFKKLIQELETGCKRVRQLILNHYEKSSC